MEQATLPTFEIVEWRGRKEFIAEQTAKYAAMDCDKPEIHIMLDIETYGKRHKAVVGSIGVVPFLLNGTILGDFAMHARFDTKDQIDNLEGTVDQSTYDWWERQSPEAKQEMTGSDSIREFMLYFCNVYIHQIRNCAGYGKIKIWSKSPSFDLMIINSWLDYFNMPKFGQYYEYEDVRTRLSLASILKIHKDHIPTQAGLATNGKVAHNAYDDAILQIKQIDVIHQRLDYLMRLENIHAGQAQLKDNNN